MPRLGRGRAAELRDEERRSGRAHEAEDEDAAGAAEERDADRRGEDHRERDGPPARGRIAGRPPEVPCDGTGAAELLPAAADPDLEPAREHEVGEPERDAQHEHRSARDDRRTDPVARREQDVERLSAEQQDPIGVRRHHRQRRGDPHRPASPPTALERAQQRKGAGEREEEEQAVHAAVDAVEEEQPARRDEHDGDEPDPRSAQPAAERRDERKAPERERRGDDPQAAETEAEVRDAPGEEEVEGSTAAIARHVLDDAGEGVSADEQRQRLVLVRRPGHQLMEEEGAGHERHAADPEPHPVPRDPRRDRGSGCCRARGRFDARLDPLRHRGFRHPRW